MQIREDVPHHRKSQSFPEREKMDDDMALDRIIALYWQHHRYHRVDLHAHLGVSANARHPSFESLHYP